MKCEYCRDLDTLKERVCESLLNPSTLTRITSIEFTSILLSHTPAASGKKSTFDSTRLRTNLLTALRDDHTDVIDHVIQVLIQYANTANETPAVIHDILEVIHDTTGFLESRGSFVICALCKYEAAETVFLNLATTLLVRIEN